MTAEINEKASDNTVGEERETEGEKGTDEQYAEDMRHALCGAADRNNEEGEGDPQTDPPYSDDLADHTLGVSREEEQRQDEAERVSPSAESNYTEEEPGGAEQIARRKAREELYAFYELFPNVRFAEIPASVLGSELPLAAAYALYEKQQLRIREAAEAENRKNRERSAGRISDGEDAHFTPEEVRRMTRSEVRANYTAILRSMKRWK